MPVYIALILLVVVASIWVPETLSRVALSAIAPFAALLAITALGQMLVIMTGGIDLSTPGTLTLAAMIMAGVGEQSDSRIWIAILTAVGVAALIGLVNGILIGGLKLNALIVTLATGQIVVGIVSRYVRTFPVQSRGAGRSVGLGGEPVPRRQPDLLGWRGRHRVLHRRASVHHRWDVASRSSVPTPCRRK